MSETITSPAATTNGVPRACTPESRLTRSLLGYGVLAGPFYVVVSLAQALTRDGFDLTRHEWSLLANGPGGWIQVVNLILTGLMVIAAAVGFRRALQGGTGAGWAPRLLGVYGAGLVAAGVFRADPMLRFPIGTPAGPPVHPTLHSTLHIAAAGVGFLALVAATFLMGARFRREPDFRRPWFARATGVAFLAAFGGVASGGGSPALNLAFTAAVVLAWAWLSLTSLGLSRTLA